MDTLKGISFAVTIQKTVESTDLQWCAGLMAANEPWISLQRNYDHSFKLLKDPLSEVYLLKDGSESLGFIMIKQKGPFTGYIQAIVFKQEYRSKGLGKAAIQYVEDLMFRTSPNVFICVSSFNEGAQKLYKALGYEVVGILKDYVLNGQDELFLRKTIGSLHDFNKEKSL